jgi:glycogen debranching enzyme
MLDSVGRKYYQTHNERSAVIAIEKSAMSLTGGVISVYPLEWVDQCIEWAKKKRRDGTPINLLALVNLINNADRKVEFVSSWRRKNPDVAIRQDIEEDKTVEEEKPSYNFD